jgi:hypothetical protein
LIFVVAAVMFVPSTVNVGLGVAKFALPVIAVLTVFAIVTSPSGFNDLRSSFTSDMDFFLGCGGETASYKTPLSKRNPGVS